MKTGIPQSISTVIALSVKWGKQYPICLKGEGEVVSWDRFLVLMGHDAETSHCRGSSAHQLAD